jgi:hypothetical protein
MEPAVRKQSYGIAAVQTATAQCQEPKRLSKFAVWRKKHPQGIFRVVDWRAVNK